jgi:hypothetical protein
MPIHDVISAVIVDRPLCLDCIAVKVSLGLTATDEALTNFARSVPIFTAPRSRCRSCRDQDDVLHRHAPHRLIPQTDLLPIDRGA